PGRPGPIGRAVAPPGWPVPAPAPLGEASTPRLHDPSLRCSPTRARRRRRPGRTWRTWPRRPPAIWPLELEHLGRRKVLAAEPPLHIRVCDAPFDGGEIPFVG